MRSLRVAWGLFWLALAIGLAGLGVCVLALVQSGGRQWLAGHVWFSPALTLTYALVGALVAARHPRNPIGWICSSVGVLSALNLLAFGCRLAAEAGTVLPGSQIVAWLGLWVWIPSTFLPLSFLLLLFPDGRLPSPRWRLVGWAAGLSTLGYTLAVALHPSPALEPQATPNPFGIPGAGRALDQVMLWATVLFAAGAIGSVAALVVRWRGARGVERAQLKWLAYAGVIGLLVNIAISAWGAGRPYEGAAYEVMLAGIMAMLLALAAAAGVAILRYRLYDIDVVINRSLVYGALTAIIAGLYVLVVGASGALLRQTGSLVFPLLVTGLIAVLFQPLRERLQRFANRLLYGERDDPYAVLSRLGRQLEAVMAPEAVLPGLAETIAQALKLPYVAIALERADSEPAEIAAAFGQPAAVAARLPLHYQAERVGELLVAARAPGETFTPAEQRLLGDIARQAGAAVHAARLTAALQHSRERLVTAREEERRRIRRDLHDGLGPTLASHSYRLDAVLDLIDQDPAAAKRLIAELKAQTQATLADIRRLVYELRPPALDELGLAAALQGQFSESANGLRVRVEAEPAALPTLPAAVEVAAFRIAAEAVTNAARHAQAQNCLVRLEACGGELRVEICDDGRGLRDGARPGVGLASMRERAAELGGACTVEAEPRGGTRVLARLPLAGGEGAGGSRGGSETHGRDAGRRPAPT